MNVSKYFVLMQIALIKTLDFYHLENQCSGALYGKTITIEPDAVIISDMTNPETDSDGDHVANILEAVMGTKTDDPNCFYPIAIPSKAMIDNTQDVTITYDFSVFFPDYPFATAVPVTFPAGSLTRSDIPLLMYIGNKPSEGINFTDPDYERIGRYLNFRSGNGLNPGHNITIGMPFAKSLSSLDKKVFHSTGSSWGQLTSTSPGNGEGFDGVKVVVDNLKPLVIAEESRLNNATLYFDNGCVFSSSSQKQLQYLINITDAASTVNNIALKVGYTDLTTSMSDVIPVDLDAVTTDGGKSFSKSGKLIFTNPVRIDNVKLVKTCTGPTEIVYEQLCGTDYTIQTGKTMQILAKTTENNITNNTTNPGSSPSYPLNGRELIAVYYPQDVSFESANFGDGRIIMALAGTPAQPYAYEYFMKDHLGSTRMVINDQGSITEAVMYQPYGTMSDVPGAISAAIPVREKFTGKEYDNEGKANGGKGINLNYFGVRYYDPELGVWLAGDPKMQDWNIYAYCGLNPMNATDPDGAKWWQWALLGMADMMTGGATSVTAGMVASGAVTTATATAAPILGTGLGAVGPAVGLTGGAMTTVGALSIDPAAYQTIGGVTNVFNNGEGIDNVGELLSTFGLGTVSGTADWGNMATFGVFHDAAARQSAGAIGLSHNVAWDKSWNDPEAYSVTYDMLSKAYGYGARGSWTKIGGEITLANHFYGELTDPSQRAAEQRNIFAMRTAKINQQDITIGNKTFYFSKIRDASEGNNNIWYNKFGHRFLGKVLGGQLAYYGFEVWGEPYETWQTDDYQDDFWTSDEPPSSFNYWDMW